METGTELMTIQTVSTKAPVVLANNKNRVSKAKTAGESLLIKIQTEGMNDDLDKSTNDYLVKCRKTYDLILNDRKPITQLLDSFKKEFTTSEGEIDPKKPESIYAKLQKQRNDYAQKKLEEQKALEAKKAKEQAVIKEKADLRASVEIAVEEFFTDHLSDNVVLLNTTLNDATLANIDEVGETIKKYSEVYNPAEHLAQVKLSIATLYLEKEDKVAIKASVIEEKSSGFITRYQERIKTEKVDLVSKVPSRKAELEQIATASKAESDRLLAEKKKKDAEAAAALEKERTDSKANAKSEATAKAGATSMQAMFEAETTEKVNRSGYEITIKHPAAFTLLFQFWFEKEGNTLAIDQLEKKTLKQMKSFCEKYAHKHNETITSAYMEYKEITKVAAR